MILVLGEILFDIFPEYRRIGGAPFNFAYHLKQLGVEVAFVSRVGQDALGEEILNFIREKGFDPGHIQVDPDHATGTVDIAVTPSGDHSFTIVPDRAYDHLAWSPPLKALCAAAPEMVYFGTLIQRTDNGCALVDKTLAACPDARRFCDINLRPGCWTAQTAARSMARAHILKLNQEELDLLVPPADQKPTDQNPIDQDPASRAASLLTPGKTHLVIVTRGELGALWVTKDKVLTGPSSEHAQLEVADTVGAGDAYAAMAAAGMLSGLCPQETLTLAHAFAADICTVQGALPKDNGVYHSYTQRLNYGSS